MKSKSMIIYLISIVILGIALVSLGVYFTSWKETRIVLDTDYNELFTDEELSEKGHKAELEEYATDVSVAYENNDGSKTLYVYSSPIRYLNSMGNFTLIDTRIANVRDKQLRNDGYIYTVANNSIKSFYPKSMNGEKGILIKNTDPSNKKEYSYEFGIYTSKAKLGWYRERKNFISNNVNAVQYRDCFENTADMYFYPSAVGTSCEINFTKKPDKCTVSFWIKADKNIYDLSVEPGGYITFKEQITDNKGNTNKEIRAVVQKPLLKDKNGKIYYNNSITLSSQGDGLYLLDFCFDKDIDFVNATAFISFEMRRESQPDNSIYSKDPDLKYAFLRNYAVVGNSDDYGIGRLLIRYKFAKYFDLKPDIIQSAKFHMYSLNQGNEEFELLSVLEDWCSVRGNWNNNYKTGDITSKASLSDNHLDFDITEETKKWCKDESGQAEHNGVLLKTSSENNGENYIILSNDSSLYNNYTEIKIN